MLSHKDLEIVDTLNYYHLRIGKSSRFENGIPVQCLNVSMFTMGDGNANVVFSRLFVRLLRAHLVGLRISTAQSTWGEWDIAKMGDQICSNMFECYILLWEHVY